MCADNFIARLHRLEAFLAGVDKLAVQADCKVRGVEAGAEHRSYKIFAGNRREQNFSRARVRLKWIDYLNDANRTDAYCLHL
jgi:hypothetical protein